MKVLLLGGTAEARALAEALMADGHTVTTSLAGRVALDTALPSERALSETLGVTSLASFPAARERRLELLGDLVEEHLDVDALLRLAREGVA